MKKTQKILSVTLALIGVVGLFITPQAVFAAECDNVQTAIISCPDGGESDNVEDTGVWQLLLIVINILTAGIGVVALGGIIYGAILYTSAGGSQEQTKKAMGIITNVIIGVVAYALMFSLLNFLIPGGVFN